MALNGLFCADVLLRNYSLTHSHPFTPLHALHSPSRMRFWFTPPLRPSAFLFRRLRCLASYRRTLDRYVCMSLKFPGIAYAIATVAPRVSPKESYAMFRARNFTYSGNFLTHFVNHVLICLFLIHLFSTVISPPEYHHHHSYHPSPRHSSIPKSKLSYFSNPTLHRHLAPLRTDFTDTQTALRLFSVSVFFLVFS